MIEYSPSGAFWSLPFLSLFGLLLPFSFGPFDQSDVAKHFFLDCTGSLLRFVNLILDIFFCSCSLFLAFVLEATYLSEVAIVSTFIADFLEGWAFLFLFLQSGVTCATTTTL